MVSERMKGLGTARSVIRELFEYGKLRAAQVGAENVFDFSLGNPSVPAPDAVNDTAIRLLQEQSDLIHAYTSAQGAADARERFADSLNRRYGSHYTAGQLYLTVGAAASLCCVFNGLACPGDEFIVFAPYFPEYKVFIEGAGAKMVLIPPEIEAFQIDFDAFQASLSPKTKGVLINSPNNPSGVVYSRATLERLAGILTEKSREYGHPIYLISDEPYREIIYSGVDVPWGPHIYRDTIVCYSFSKSLSLPGERIGYVLVPGDITDSGDVYAAVAGAGRSLGYVCAPSLFQQVTSLCCDMTSDITVYETNRNLLVTSLREMGYHVVEPGGAFYLFPRTLESDDMAFSERAKQLDLLVVPGSGFGAPGHVRISYCVQTETIRRALPKFKELADFYK
ncbi:pyridoxal phosphate-dependent aminotransferase [Pseudoflavonifractor sp. 60]|uniref:pyridoxal phosphate-dependent aminotransferase n=1 Tax=Pseudoflavonifractor sp. 60 TaxID=2304576 RepID=UPI0013701187|nr:pyridoxal phosphate-dependent aminotransferase [Pseudoflavonifractor sp. 60]NBI68059.1 pyridoxal phosphate-dependent aminotransferase [Pseudoflavonifractor sp. 60]